MTFSVSSLPWHTRVRNAIEQGDDILLNELLALPETRTRFLGGFMLFGQDSKVSFAEMCHRLGRLDRLEQVLDAAPGGVSLDDLCSVYDIDESAGLRPILMGYRSSWPMAEEAVRSRDLRLLSMVLRKAPDHITVQTGRARLAGMTVHAYTLVAGMLNSNEDIAAVMFDMSRALHAAGAPVVSNGSSTDMAFLLADTLWTDEAARHAERRLHELVNAGAIDINASRAGLTPLETALEAGNGHGAAAIIRAHCSLDMAGSGFSDPISYAQNITDLREELKAKTVALVTEAYMSRRLLAQAPTTQLSRPTRRSRMV